MEAKQGAHPAAGAGISKDAALVSEHAASGMHCRFPNGKRTPAVLDSEKQGYECDAPKVGDPLTSSAARRCEGGSRERMQLVLAAASPLRMESSGHLPAHSMVSAVMCRLASCKHVHACPAELFSLQGCSAGDLNKYQLCANNGAVLDDGSCTVKGGCALSFCSHLVQRVAIR